MKKFFALLIVVAMAFAITACSSSDSGEAGTNGGGGNGQSENGGSITVGLLAPLTGDVAQYGLSVASGAELYIKEINEAGGINGKTIEVIKYDEQGDATEAVNNYYRLVDDGVVGIIGDVTSAPTVAVAQASVEDNMPMVTASATDPSVISYGSNFFQACLNDPYQGTTMAKFAANELGVTSVATIYNTGDDYSIGCNDAFVEQCNELDVQVLSQEGYADGDVDFNAQLTSIIASGAQAIFCPNYYQDDGMIVTQARTLGFTGSILGVDGWTNTHEYTDPENLYDCYFCTSFAIIDDEKINEFVDAYRAENDKDPGNFEALGYDAAMVLLNGIKAAEDAGLEAGTDDYKQAVIDGIANGTVEGVTGEISYDGTGAPTKSIMIVSLDSGSPEFYMNY